MSEYVNNQENNKKKLKQLLLQLHEGRAQEEVRAELICHLQGIPYGDVVEVEQELISEGLPEEEILKFCDVHTQVLEGRIDSTHARKVDPGHPVDVFRKENQELLSLASKIETQLVRVPYCKEEEVPALVLALLGSFNLLMDVDKHYKRKEYLLFPFLEQKGITGPPKVMWGKHDETRVLLKGAIEVLKTPGITNDDFETTAELVLIPALKAVADMVKKEEEILLPMALDQLSEKEWYEVHRQTLEIGYCLYDPVVDWKPEENQGETGNSPMEMAGQIRLPSGSFDPKEILAILNMLPVDITFVDKEDKVKYFSQGKDRIFTRSRAIINRDVRLCHPPGSVHIVEKILDDFKFGRESHAPFWIQMRGKFIYIQYFALRDEQGEYLGTLEVSQDITELRKLEGEQRILSYSK